MDTVTEPKLEAPGAGLPAPVLFVAKRLFALKCKTGSREKFVAGFRAERAAIEQMAQSCPEDKRGERVLVPRLRGLEDSSRYWSVWMTLDHLRIVNDGVGDFIVELSEKREPDRVVGTADVKPNPAVGAEIVQGFADSCDAFLSKLDGVDELQTGVTFPHPWFGPLDAFRWLGLASMHMGIHRKQIAAILSGLNS